MTHRRRTLHPLACARALHAAHRHRLALGTLVALIANASPVRAAGGHHAVDDAAMLDPGQCQIETWFDHENGTHARCCMPARPAASVASSSA